MQQVLDGILEDSAGVRGELRRRLGHVKSCLSTWQKGDVAAALNEAVRCRDDGALCDVMSCVSGAPRELTLDSFVLLLPRLAQLLESDNDDHTVASMHTIQVPPAATRALVLHSPTSCFSPGAGLCPCAEAFSLSTRS